MEQADTLVLEVVQDLQTTFGSERSSLETQWQSGEDVQTEDLRGALPRRYRSFFDRLLSGVAGPALGHGQDHQEHQCGGDLEHCRQRGEQGREQHRRPENDGHDAEGR